jgi:hypothetical protein
MHLPLHFRVSPLHFFFFFRFFPGLPGLPGEPAGHGRQRCGAEALEDGAARAIAGGKRLGESIELPVVHRWFSFIVVGCAIARSPWSSLVIHGGLPRHARRMRP